MKTHSREWFLQQIDATKKSIATWPEWMKEGRTVATASFPKVGDERKAIVASQPKQLEKRKAHG